MENPIQDITDQKDTIDPAAIEAVKNESLDAVIDTVKSISKSVPENSTTLPPDHPLLKPAQEKLYETLAAKSNELDLLLNTQKGVLKIATNEREQYGFHDKRHLNRYNNPSVNWTKIMKKKSNREMPLLKNLSFFGQNMKSNLLS
jgi:hypothetical protein